MMQSTKVQANPLGSLGAATAPQRCPKFTRGPRSLSGYTEQLLDVGYHQGEDITLCKAAHSDQPQVPGSISSQYSQQLANECLSPGGQPGGALQHPLHPNAKIRKSFLLFIFSALILAFLTNLIYL